MAAVAGYAEALANGGEWLVRIEDLDPTREEPDAAEQIVESLEQHGMVFPVPIKQSQRSSIYEDALNTLIAGNSAYPCSCSRKTLMATADRGLAGLIYPGTCRRHPAAADSNAVRYRCVIQQMAFDDGVQGTQRIDIATEIGDFLLRRGDRHFSYQLAVAVDDADQQITHVLRGTDLITSTFMQLAVLKSLGLPAPHYAHFPVVKGADGHKLSKQRKSAPIKNKEFKNNIFSALYYLNQQPPTRLKTAQIGNIWSWVAEHWTLSKLREIRYTPEKEYD